MPDIPHGVPAKSAILWGEEERTQRLSPTEGRARLSGFRDDDGMEACDSSRGKYPEGRLVHITFRILLDLVGLVGSLSSVISFVLYLHDRKKK